MINCIILAGGNSSRMKFPKEFIKIDKKYLIHNSIEDLKRVFEDIVVVSNNKEHYKELNVRVVRDVFYKKGPLAGLHSGLSYSKAEYSFLIACDMPVVNLDFINFMISEVESNFEGVVCIDKNNKILPMNGIYKNSLKEKLRESLIKDEKKFTKFIENNNFKYINYENWKKYEKFEVFKNLNTEKELEEYKSLKTFDGYSL